MDTISRLTRFIQDVFKTTLDIFLEALQLSPNAQGYVSGSITELLLKRVLERDHGLEVKRIKEKWEGTKHLKHHGDLYFRRPPDGAWYVLESKGVKSNSERWHKLYNLANLDKFLTAHSEKIPWVDQAQPAQPQVQVWLRRNLPRMFTDYAQLLYDYEEVSKYIRNRPKRETPKSRAIDALGTLSREEIARMIDERISYVRSRVSVLETHLVSGTSASSQRTQATPRKDEFNLLAVDLVLRWHDHKFLFTNPNLLDPSEDDNNHLQQNYVIGFTFSGDSDEPSLSYTEEWFDNFADAFDTLDAADAVSEADMQIDQRLEADGVGEKALE